MDLLGGLSPTAGSLVGGHRALLWLGIVLLQAVFVGLLLIDPAWAVALVGGLLVFTLALRYPYAAVLVAVVARLTATNALSIRFGPVYLSAFEPLFVLAFAALFLRSVQQRKSQLQDFPLSKVMLAFLVWVSLSLVWSADRGEGVMLFLRLLIAFGIVWLVASVARTPDRYYGMLWAWLIGSCAIGTVGLIVGTYESTVYGDIAFKSMSGGGRIGGLGQHPNWFAMAMAFGINPAFVLAYTEKSRLKRVLLVGAALWLLLVAVSTGSRGAVWGTGMGSLFLALHNTRLRLFLYRFWFLILGAFAVALLVGFGSLTSAFYRIATRGISTFWQGDVRFANWQVCYEMLIESLGLGVGAGSYEILVPAFNDRLSLSMYAYPHGVLWDVMAHYGLIGLLIWGALCVLLVRHYRQARTAVAGTRVELWLIGMMAGVVGYWAHSLVEFHLEDKPYWTFLGVFLGLIVAAKKLGNDPEELERYRRDDSSAPKRAGPVSPPGGGRPTPAGA